MIINENNSQNQLLSLYRVEGGELFDRVVDDEFILNERVCVVFIRQLCEAMEYIHRHNILHLDLKPENILCLTEEGNRIKIIDFGLARKYDPDKKLQVNFYIPNGSSSFLSFFRVPRREKNLLIYFSIFGEVRRGF